jgi:hypothetical protein
VRAWAATVAAIIMKKGGAGRGEDGGGIVESWRSPQVRSGKVPGING